MLQELHQQLKYVEEDMKMSRSMNDETGEDYRRLLEKRMEEIQREIDVITYKLYGE